MADHDITIKVNQVGSGDALDKAADAAERLHRAAQGQASRSQNPWTTASAGAQEQAGTRRAAEQQSARQADNLRMRREEYFTELQAAELRARGHTREAEALERQLEIRRRAAHLQQRLNFSPQQANALATREVDARRAAAAHKGGMSNARMIGEMLDMVTGQQGWVMRAMMVQRLPHLLKAAVATPMAAATSVAAVAYAGASAYYGQKDKDLALQDKIREESGASRDRLKRSARYATDAGQFAEGERDLEDERKKLIRQRETLEHRAQSGVAGRIDKALGSDFFTKGLGWYKPESARALEENAAEQERLRKEQAEHEHERKRNVERFTRPSIEAQERMNHGDMKGARALQDNVTWLKRYNELMKETKDDVELSRRGADAEIAAVQKERTGSYAHFINSRTSSAAAARIAAMAAGETQTGYRSAEDGRIVSTMKEQHADMKNAATQADFVKR